MNCCCVCGRNITGTSWLCHKCARENAVEDVPFAQWPDWLKMFADQEQAERREYAGPVVLTLSECPHAERLCYGEAPGNGEWD